MYRRQFLAAAGALAVAGCTTENSTNAATPTDDCECSETPTGNTAAHIRLTSIGQDAVEDGNAVRVQGMVANGGASRHDTTIVIQLLDDGTVVAERRLDVGTLAPDETATFSTTIEVDAAAVNGRQITFE